MDGRIPAANAASIPTEQADLSVVGVLDRAAALLANPASWTQGVSRSRNDHGEPCWCAMGAIREIVGQPFHAAEEALRDVLSGGVGITGWNDAPGRKHEDVIDAFRRASAKARVTA